MPNFISAGVFTSEIDQSGVAQGVADIGAVIVAPFSKGVAFSPTVCNDLATLQSKFGIADGTFYGPYTAAKYLQEKGFVTVCRVGALTGYHQKYPLVIWAEKGQWTRGADAGVLATASIVTHTQGVLPTNVNFNSTNTQNINVSSGSYTGSISFSGQPISVTLVGGQGTATVGVFNNSGSNIYYGQTITGYISGVIDYSGTLAVPTASATSASILNAILLDPNSHFFKKFNSTTIPFTSSALPGGLLLTSASVSQSVGNCNFLNLNINGFLTGNFNYYDGGFQSGSGHFDACIPGWVSDTTGSVEYRVLAVLADTQWGGINSRLEAPGFYSSSISRHADNGSVGPSGSNQVINEFDLQLSSSLGSAIGTYHFSLDSNDPHYITNVFGNDPTAGDPAKYVTGTKIEAAYIYNLFPATVEAIQSSPDAWKVHVDAMPSGTWINEPLNFTDANSLNVANGDSAFSVTHASTPWILSQQISSWNNGAAHRFNLFRLHTLDDGTYTNTSYKIEISNVKLAGTVAGSDWGTFTLTVREFSDTDRKPVILEQYSQLTLDPTSPDFIARRIGDRYNYINFAGKIIEFGTYTTLSKYIRVEVSDINYPTSAVPYGFAQYSTPVDGAMGYWVPKVKYSKASVYGLFPGRYPSGVDFNGPPSGADSELIGLYPTASVNNFAYTDNAAYFAPVPVGSTAGRNDIFALDTDITGSGITFGSYISGSNVVPSTYDAANETTYVKMRKFVLGFQGGFDGQSPSIPINVGNAIVAGNTQGLNCRNSTAAGSVAYAQCIGALGNADEFDINLISTPGIIYSLHSYVTTLVVDMCENRGDCFYIADLYEDGGNPATGQIDEVVSLADQFDTSYAGTYYPWVKIKDTNTNQIVTVPPSVVMPAVYAANDKVAGEWWAAAGLNRGGIPDAVQVTDRTTHLERDTLYAGRVNPIAAFPGEGIVVWGQKTLQVKKSALDRISVRRLLIELKKYIASIAKYLVFEQNTAATRNKFLSIVNPYLEGIQQRSGLYAFQVIMDDTNNTADVIDQNMLIGSIAIKPTKTAEFIYLPFTVLSTGASFPNA